ncbi:mucin-5B-like, partial [Coregonus clupeaformis]|uniref:mucin-5B-like n=1 Tax=Coregonus clupeaformis TaxID=59861 RepID=UPI001E1C95BA
MLWNMCPEGMCCSSTKRHISHHSAWEVLVAPSDRCVKYDCTKRNDQFIVVKTKLECPVFSPEDCVPGTEKTDANGCCTSCTPISHCDVKNTTTYLEVKNCRSTVPVEIAACGGS